MSDKRKFGWAALQLVSPEMAEKIREFDFNDATEKCRELVARIAPEETTWTT